MTEWPDPGTRVRVVDHSDTHGDVGSVFEYCLNDRGEREICLVLLDVGCVWPLVSPSELENE